STTGRHGRLSSYRAVPCFTIPCSTPSRTLVSHGDRRRLLLGHNYGARDPGSTRLSGQVAVSIGELQHLQVRLLRHRAPRFPSLWRCPPCERRYALLSVPCAMHFVSQLHRATGCGRASSSMPRTVRPSTAGGGAVVGGSDGSKW